METTNSGTFCIINFFIPDLNDDQVGPVISGKVEFKIPEADLFLILEKLELSKFKC